MEEAEKEALDLLYKYGKERAIMFCDLQYESHLQDAIICNRLISDYWQQVKQILENKH